MIVTLLLVAAAVLFLAFLIRVVRGQAHAVADLTDLSQQTKPVDVAAFRNLIDPAEEEYLRTNLRTREFRAVQRRRTVATIAYVKCAQHNAAVLLRVGQAARRSSDPTVVAAANQLVNSAMRLRISAAMALVKLYPASIVPLVRVSPNAVADAYQQLTSVVSHLIRLQHPAMATRVSGLL